MAARISPARRAFWKRLRPTSLRHALEACKEHAREMRNLSVQRIAERMALPDHWVLYKWIESGRMPAVCIPAYQEACGINLVTRWLAGTERRLLVDMPIGKPASAADLVQLGSGFQQAVQLLSDFYESGGAADPAPVLEALGAHMQDVAHHHFNVSGFAEPQLELEP